MMRIGLAIDAACDLSHAFLLQHNVSVMPIAVRVDGEVFMDDREPAEIQRFINRRLGSRSHSAETYPFSVKQIENFFLNRLVLEKDCMFCLTMMATRSPINEHVNRATFGILKNYRKVREAASVPGPFMMRVIDTQNLFAGTAPPVYEAARMIKANAPVATIRERLNFIANNTYTYSVPRDLYYIRARGKKKNEQSVSLFSAMLGSAMDIKPLLRAYRGETSPVGKVRGFDHGADVLFGYAARRVRAGLLAPFICLSYGGDLGLLPTLPGYATLQKACQVTGVELMEAPMSISGMVNMGEGAVTIGFSAERHEPDF
jgi:fatty acid-binding protein DegV